MIAGQIRFLYSFTICVKTREIRMKFCPSLYSHFLQHYQKNPLFLKMFFSYCRQQERDGASRTPFFSPISQVKLICMSCSPYMGDLLSEVFSIVLYKKSLKLIPLLYCHFFTITEVIMEPCLLLRHMFSVCLNKLFSFFFPALGYFFFEVM